ncbi:hypothetical protein ACF0H5_010116 [Mactra antiquata]
MAYFPKIGPFYDPQHEQQFYGEADGRLRLRKSADNRLRGVGNTTNDDSWNHVVQDHENMFYTEPVDNNTQVHRISSISINHRRQESFQSVGSVGSYHSGSSESPRQFSSRQNSIRSDGINSDHVGSDHSGNSHAAIGRHFLQSKDRLPDWQRPENFQRENVLRQSDPSYLSFSHNLNSENGPHRTSQRLPFKTQQNCNFNQSSNSGLTVSQSGKRKSVNMVPNLKHIDDVQTSSGLVLCEKLYGIKICHYKQKPPRPNGANMEMVLRDRKVIVQDVIADSQADICGQINRGDMLVAMNDIDLTWLNMDELLRQSSRQNKDDIIYRYPHRDNKILDIRGLFLTLTGLLPDITDNQPKLSSVNYRGENTHIVYWKHCNDVLLLALPENRVPSYYLLHVFNDLLRIVQMLYGSVVRLFCDQGLHNDIDELMSLTLYRLLSTGVHTQTIPYCTPLEPVLLDTLNCVRWLQLNQDDIISCDEILSEFEAQDFTELEDVDPDERRKFGILGSCLFYRDYLLCSHLQDEDVHDVFLFLKYNCILHLVNKQTSEDLEIWREIYPTRLCNRDKGDKPGYREPKGRWFLLVVSMRHFLFCTILESGSYSKVAIGKQCKDEFFIEQCKVTLAQLDLDDTDIELQCNERLFSEQTGPTLKCIDDDKKSIDMISPVKSPSPKINIEDNESKVILSPNLSTGMKRQGSRLSYGSNDSSGSSTSINKIRSGGKKGSSYDIDIINRSFSKETSRTHNDIKLTKGLHNQLFYYVNFNKFAGICISPTPYDLATVQGSCHQHLMFNFYGCCLKLHEQFNKQIKKKEPIRDDTLSSSIEEGVMFTCQLPVTSQNKKQSSVIMYWVIGRRFPDGHEMFVCLEDGTPQCLLELAFTYNFGLT